MENIDDIYEFAKELFPINRSITGDGVRETLEIIDKKISGLTTHEVRSGEKCFDWTIPKEWNVKDAWIKNSKGEKIIDFSLNNLHLMGYSIPVNEKMDLEALRSHLFYLVDQPEAIPYITSYYTERWGFCLTYNQFQDLEDDLYHVCIDSTLESGHLTYGEVYIPGESDEEILLSTNICHPSMGNNELSGIVVTAYLTDYLQKLSKRRYSYRILFLPETIGSICYLSKHSKELKSNVKAGFVIVCVGDNNTYSFLPSRNGDTLADSVARLVLEDIKDVKYYSFLDRGSDERQFCSPLIDLPVVSVMRSKYGEYPEYHTSLDNLEFISKEGLTGSFNIYKKIFFCLENNYYPKANVPCEPNLGSRGLYPKVSTKTTFDEVYSIINLLTYADGMHSMIDIARRINRPITDLITIGDKLFENDLLVKKWVKDEKGDKTFQ